MRKNIPKMSNISPFQQVLEQFRKSANNERSKGDKFERLMQAFLITEPTYKDNFSDVWLWSEFPCRGDFAGGKDLGIDLVCKTKSGEYWAVQCKFYDETTQITKEAVDTFLSTSGKQFVDNATQQTTRFAKRLWISTSDNWSSNAEETLNNQQTSVSRIGFTALENASVEWELLAKGITGEQAQAVKKELREHQQTALEHTHYYFKDADRGKLIMACGTGKTFTSLKIAEKETEGKGLVLFLVPSIALLGQTLREWSAQANKPINSVCICSDSRISDSKAKRTDTSSDSVVDLGYPATTDVNDILHQFDNIKKYGNDGMTVVFSTYQSIERIADAQKVLLENGYPEFDLIICDEAHRTTGVTLKDDDDESSFVKVHNNDFIRAKKRLYMTATPKLYGEDAKSKADEMEAVLCSMDDERLFGSNIYTIGFGEAVQKGLLCDYKVLILTVSSNDVPPAVQDMVAGKSSEINSTDAAKLIGCINALSKQILGDANLIKSSDPEPMRRAVAFCEKIKVSEKITNAFSATQQRYLEDLSQEVREQIVNISSDHIDGSMGANVRERKMNWLKGGDSERNECRILTNVRCLSEGVDVPTLDAVMFLSPRNSQIEVVQSVGRVMRTADGKKYGYIIIPIVVPSDVEAEKALDKNDAFRVVWEVLRALRSHDDRFNATINKIELNRAKPENILIGRPASRAKNDFEKSTSNAKESAEYVRQLVINYEPLQSIIYGKIVQKVGQKRYWEQWAKDVAEIAQRYTERITRLIGEDKKHSRAFESFLRGLQRNINPSITESEAIDMLSQHIITKPVFEALFEDYSFVKSNAISVSMQKMLDLLEEQSLEKDAQTLEKFYNSVKERARGLDNAEAKQKIIVELYDKFFKTAFPKMVEKLGIVYTPTEVVDFIIQSVDVVLRKEFGRNVSDENVHILDPFTGTGTFITRLLQSGLIKPQDLHRKYKHELHANEIVLLAYYIAAINIENAYHDLAQAEGYVPFDGICLTDTFQLGENNEHEKLFSEMFEKNSKRVIEQKKAPIRIIIGNPPYSVGQKSANDNAQNQSYTKLDGDIARTYAQQSSAGLNKSLYDAYIKAFRWSTDRLDEKNGGIIAFVSNGAWIDGNSTDGFRKCLEKEFSTIYVFNLRGNQRTSGELSRQEGGKIFGSGSRTPIAITILIKKPKASTEKATIHYHDIGNYLSREDKLKIINEFGSIGSIDWQTLTPNEHGDWINERSDIFDTFIPLAPLEKKNHKTNSFFITYSNGLATSRDAWLYNSSKYLLSANLTAMIDFYNNQRLLFAEARKKDPTIQITNFVNYDSSEISWSDIFLRDANNNTPYVFNKSLIGVGLYRPFHKQFLCYDKAIIHRTYQQYKLFPKLEYQNIVIIISGVGASKGFSALASDCVPNYHTLDTDQCFPLYYYDEIDTKNATLFDDVSKDKYIRRDAISDFILERSRVAYGNRVSKEDIFYYVYGILHSTEYRTQFASDLKKMLPRLPLVDEPKEFWAFSKAGRALAELHLNYETIEPSTEVRTIFGSGSQINYRVDKMKFPKEGKKTDKSKIIYNHQITIENIPLVAYDYVVNGKSAIEWIMERYAITTHKDSGITNDPNDWATEHNDPKYIYNLLLRIIHLSVESVNIINTLPKLTF